MTGRAGGPGLLCLQGGRELTEPCLDMDRAVIDHVDGRTVVIAGAARPGSDYAGASARTVAHYARLRVEVEVVQDPRHDPDAALAALAADIGLVVLPGGSPGGLLDVLSTVARGAIGARLVEAWRAGAAISGASAGAMVLCTRTATPDRGSGLADGLGLVEGIALPHWSPGSERRWSLPDATWWGLPECGGIIVDGDGVVAVGRGRPSVRVDGRWRPIGRDRPEPLPRH